MTHPFSPCIRGTQIPQCQLGYKQIFQQIRRTELPAVLGSLMTIYGIVGTIKQNPHPAPSRATSATWHSDGINKIEFMPVRTKQLL
jgi:hypothetical protein